ncbi:hypothetical protein RSOLAG1IB_12558 [Rhizoctonia solani AG-1 IB]|uniref:Tyrosine specific protein phosphatases domain-containing protein n=1 Tax=Thanatephorus cucumeris (strain AG1-IB / isolate 7/3/14) TaxID=1108050 RepID=A0A0B7G1L8_THACB|nr:hypothetical protein RSOLAG1IB_12558 [Rhizoctonia solani AG-1 IB]
MADWVIATVDQYIPAGTRLFRSSAPGYLGHDEKQELTDSQINTLLEKQIKCIFSLNSEPYSEATQGMLGQADITYIHYGVKDFRAPSGEIMRAGYDSLMLHNSMLVHCGAGYGRTGTLVTAVQLYATDGSSPEESKWESVNHVEEEPQMEALRKLRSSLRLKKDQLGIGCVIMRILTNQLLIVYFSRFTDELK